MFLGTQRAQNTLTSVKQTRLLLHWIQESCRAHQHSGSSNVCRLCFTRMSSRIRSFIHICTILCMILCLIDCRGAFVCRLSHPHWDHEVRGWTSENKPAAERQGRPLLNAPLRYRNHAHARCEHVHEHARCERIHAHVCAVCRQAGGLAQGLILSLNHLKSRHELPFLNRYCSLDQ